MTIKDYRQKKGLTQKALADALGCSLQAVKFWETGRREPTEKFAKKLKRRGVEV